MNVDRTQYVIDGDCEEFDLLARDRGRHFELFVAAEKHSSSDCVVNVSSLPSEDA